MYTIKDLSGLPKTYATNDGDSIRILPYSSVEVADSKITTEIERDYENGVILLSKKITKVTKKKDDEEGGNE